MRRDLPEAHSGELVLEEADVEVHVIRSEHTSSQSAGKISSHVPEPRRVGYIVIGDPMNLCCGNAALRVDQRIEYKFGWFSRIDSHYGEFNNAIRTRVEACRLEVQDSHRTSLDR